MPSQVCTFSPNPLTGFKKCVSVAPEPEPVNPTAIFAVTTVVVLLGAVLHKAFPAHSKQHAKLSGWQRELGELLEGKMVVAVVVLLILTDLSCTAYNTLVDEGEWSEWTEFIGFSCLIVFFVEQLLHLVAFGFDGFFGNPWFVLDLLAVSVTAMLELNEEALEEYGIGEDFKLIVLVRLWKLFVFIFDIFLAEHEAVELVELVEEKKKD